MAYPGEFRFYVRRAHHITIREAAEIQLHTRLEAPIERNFIYRDGAASAVHGRCVMIWGIQMSAVVGDEIDPLDSPCFAIRQVLGTQSRKKLLDLRNRHLVVDVLDARPVGGRI